MTPEHFKQIEELYQAARTKSGRERAVVLSNADPEVRRLVESLLAHGDSGKLPELPDGTVTIMTSGQSLGPYRIEGKVGEGGMGEVFRAVDTRLGRTVAVKMLHERFGERFEREARAISSINHPNVCTLYDVGPNYLVMEFVEGETVAARLKSGPLPLATAVAYAMQIVSALVDAHGKGIVHRDLKPGNLMIGKTGIKVLDFGLAKSTEDETLTASRAIMGTPAYMAPEQREGSAADERSDIYSFGAVLYEMLTGARIGSQRRRIAPRKLERIVERCLEEDPGKRWQSAAALERELKEVSAGRSALKIGAGCAAVLAVAGGAYFYLHRAPKLTDKDTIVLSDFTNNTGDSIFDGTLRQGLAIQLEQSPFLKIMDEDQAQRVLHLMGVAPGSRITGQVARGICAREGAAATIDGSISALGRSYIISLQAVACQDGVTLAREQVQADDKEHVLSALGTAAAQLRGKLGESRNSIQRLNRPLQEATTPSLEALRYYNDGTAMLGTGKGLAAVPLFERATELDPNFASAYFRLGVAFEQAGDTARSREYARRAFALVDRVSEFERNEIKGYYYRATGEVDKEIESWQAAASTYPREWSFHNQLSVVYIDLGRYEEGLKEALETAALTKENDAPYRRQLDVYICLDRLADAKRVGEECQRKQRDGPRIHQRFLEAAYVADDQAAISKEIEWFAGKPEEYLSLGLQAAYLNVHGQRSESHRFYQRASEMAARRGLGSVAGEFEEADARADALSGNCETVRRLGRPAQALALCGDTVRAEKLAAEASKAVPNGTIWNEVQLPVIRAAGLLKDDPAKSVELLAPASTYERSYLEPVYLRGLAYLRLGKGAEAAAEFQKIVDHKGASWGATWIHPNWGLFYSLSYLGIGRGAALAGDRPRAQKAFLELFTLWDKADPDLPVLRQAKAEFEKLR